MTSPALVQPGLHRSVAWDLIIVLLPYLDSPFALTVEIAESLIHLAAETGNPREVYVKVLQGLSSLAWVPGAGSGDDDYYEDDDEVEDEEGGGDGEDDDAAEHSGSEHAVPRRRFADQAEDPALPANRALARFRNLLSALCVVHPRITARFPSKFLSTELSTLLVAFTKAVKTVNAKAVTEIVEQLLAFVNIAGPPPMLAQHAPPSPPGSTPAPAGLPVASGSDPERQLQVRLISSFLSHLLSAYVLQTCQPSSVLAPPPQGDGLAAPIVLVEDEAAERGFELGWAGTYDELVLRPDKSKVPGGRTLIDEERENRAAYGTVKALVDEICLMCERLGLQTEELLQVCQEGAGIFPPPPLPLPPPKKHILLDNKGADADVSEPYVGDGDDASDIPAPKAAADVPLSKTGALFLLSNRLASRSSEMPTNFRIYPEHAAIAEAFMIYDNGQSQPAVVDAVLFLGQLALHTGGLGDAPGTVERFFIYLQIFSVISTSSPAPQSRFLANDHVARCLHAHPDEAARLAYIRDALEHCPFESIKAVVVGFLKDEIIHATTTPTPGSIFGTHVCLHDVFDVLFPDLEKLLGDGADDDERSLSDDEEPRPPPSPAADAAAAADKKAWENLKDMYPRFMATLNFCLFILLNKNLRQQLSIKAEFVDKAHERFLEPVRRRLAVFKALEVQESGGNPNMMWMAEMTMTGIADVRPSISCEP